MMAEVPTLAEPYPDVLALTRRYGKQVPFEGRSGTGWSLADSDASELFDKMLQRGVPLGEFLGDGIRYGIKTGLNQAFVIPSVPTLMRQFSWS
jgi:hypothetical protein